MKCLQTGEVAVNWEHTKDEFGCGGRGVERALPSGCWTRRAGLGS